jgi:mycothiol synthase
MRDPRIDLFLQKLTTADGIAPLSDAKVAQFGNPERTLFIEEGDRIVAAGVAAHHLHVDGTDHWSVETALEGGLRFPEFEERLLQSALALVPADRALSVWSQRRSLDSALAGAGFVATRELAYMSIDLPIDGEDEIIGTRPLQPEDTLEVLALNRAAFSSHREAGSLEEPEFRGLLDEVGMGPSGLLVVEEADEIVGFCWTRVHESGDGEIFRIAVDPRNQGRGIGGALVLAGYDHLARNQRVSKGTLWVDISNEAALSLYRRLGMREVRVNREFEVVNPPDSEARK